MNLPRNEYPRPQFVRKNWKNLNGEWEFSFEQATFDQKIIVPYAFQSKLSGIEDPSFHDTVWYRRRFSIDENLAGQRLLLHFGAVDYESTVLINNQKVMDHVGGQVGFTIDITDYVESGENVIIVKAFDPSTDLEIPRGKQYWKEKSESIFYTRTTGIWQTVWMELVPENYLRTVWMTPNIDTQSVHIRYELEGNVDCLEVNLSFAGDSTGHFTVHNPSQAGECTVQLDFHQVKDANTIEHYFWTPETPHLFDVSFKAQTGDQVDEVTSYFGMRKVSIEQGRFLLNNHPYYQKLLLDQGYWEDSLLTAPTDNDFIVDIQMAKEMGFNGVRKHQKVEDPRFLYHADQMGFLIWGEIAAAYVYSRPYVRQITHEWMDMIFRDYNHPCIVAWTPLNESWGVQNINTNEAQQSHSAAMVYLTKSLDTSRAVISNDGWEHTVTDILGLHDYTPDKAVLLERYRTVETTLASLPSNRPPYAKGWSYRGEPIIITEFGGISYKKGDWEGWGYSNAVSDEDFINRYHAVVSALLESPAIQGFCYTEITDVEQEINGLLTYDRKYKIAPEIIRAINENEYVPEDSQ